MALAHHLGFISLGCPRYTFRRGSSRHMALAHHLFFSLSLGCPIPGIHLEGVIGNWGIVWPGFSRFKAFVFDGAKDQLVQVSLSWYLVGTTKSPFSQDGFGDFVLPYQNQIGQGLMLDNI